MLIPGRPRRQVKEALLAALQRRLTAIKLQGLSTPLKVAGAVGRYLPDVDENGAYTLTRWDFVIVGTDAVAIASMAAREDEPAYAGIATGTLAQRTFEAMVLAQSTHGSDALAYQVALVEDPGTQQVRLLLQPDEGAAKEIVILDRSLVAAPKLRVTATERVVLRG